MTVDVEREFEEFRRACELAVRIGENLQHRIDRALELLAQIDGDPFPTELERVERVLRGVSS